MQRHVNRHLERVIRRTILDAKLSGKDYPTQNKVAAHTVRRIRPDTTAPEAVALVDLARRDEIEAARGWGFGFFVSGRLEAPRRPVRKPQTSPHT